MPQICKWSGRAVPPVTRSLLNMGKKGSTVPWMSWDEYQVGSWMKKHGLERYATLFIENGIAGENLPDCLDENKLARESYTYARSF